MGVLLIDLSSVAVGEDDHPPLHQHIQLPADENVDPDNLSDDQINHVVAPIFGETMGLGSLIYAKGYTWVYLNNVYGIPLIAGAHWGRESAKEQDDDQSVGGDG